MKALYACLAILALLIAPLSYAHAKHAKSKDRLDKPTEAKLVQCIDGDTARFKIPHKFHNKPQTVRFLLIDTPEIGSRVELYGPEAARYTCRMLKKAKKIKLQTDGRLRGKHGRLLAWVWVDRLLLQEQIAKKGFVKKYYDYGKYRYEERVKSARDKYLSHAVVKSRHGICLKPDEREAFNRTWPAYPTLKACLKDGGFPPPSKE